MSPPKILACLMALAFALVPHLPAPSYARITVTDTMTVDHPHRIVVRHDDGTAETGTIDFADDDDNGVRILYDTANDDLEFWTLLSGSPGAELLNLSNFITGGGGISPGSSTNSVLRWDGSDWSETTAFQVDSSGNATLTGNLTAGTASASDTHDFTGFVTINGNLAVDGNATLGDASGDSHTVNGGLSVTGSLTAGSASATDLHAFTGGIVPQTGIIIPATGGPGTSGFTGDRVVPILHGFAADGSEGWGNNSQQMWHADAYAPNGLVGRIVWNFWSNTLAPRLFLENTGSGPGMRLIIQDRIALGFFYDGANGGVDPMIRMSSDQSADVTANTGLQDFHMSKLSDNTADWYFAGNNETYPGGIRVHRNIVLPSDTVATFPGVEAQGHVTSGYASGPLADVLGEIAFEGDIPFNPSGQFVALGGESAIAGGHEHYPGVTQWDEIGGSVLMTPWSDEVYHGMWAWEDSLAISVANSQSAKPELDQLVIVADPSSAELRLGGNGFDIVAGADVDPSVSATYDLGSSSLRWYQLWADRIDLTGNLAVDGITTLGDEVGDELNINVGLINMNNYDWTDAQVANDLTIRSDDDHSFGQTSAPTGVVEIYGGSTEGHELLTLDQDDQDEAFIDFQGTFDNAGDPADSGNLTTTQGAGGVVGPMSPSGSYGWSFGGMVKVEVNGSTHYLAYYSVEGAPECPRVDAWIDGDWVEVGRAIKWNEGIENRGLWTIKLAQAASRFRLVEDEPEISYIDWIRGSNGETALENITTWPADPGLLGQTTPEMFVLEFEFSEPVTHLDTHGYYDLVTP